MAPSYPMSRPPRVGSALATILVTGILLAPVAAGAHPQPESCDDEDSCEGEPSAAEPVASTAEDSVAGTVPPTVGDIHDLAAREYDRACEGHLGDWGTSQDAGATVGDALRIGLEAGLRTSWLAWCDASRGDMLQRDRDTYIFDVHEGDLVTVTVVGATCRMSLPDGEDGLRKTHGCGGSTVAKGSGTGVIRTWGAPEALVGGSTARPYVIGVWTSRVEVTPEADRTISSSPSLPLHGTSDPGSADRRDDPERGIRPTWVSSGTADVSPTPATASPWWIAAVIELVVLLAAAWLYRRVTRDDALDHEIRSSIVDRVRTDPGITPAELAEDLDVAHETILHHVRILEDLDLVAAHRDGKYIRLFQDGTPDRRDHPLVAALRRDGRAEVLRVLRREPGLTISEIARRLDRHRTTVQHHADALEEANLVRENGGDGRCLEIPEEVLASWRRFET